MRSRIVGHKAIARIEMINITTSNSINENPDRCPNLVLHFMTEPPFMTAFPTICHDASRRAAITACAGSPSEKPPIQ
jgi:hypothetical protein